MRAGWRSHHVHVAAERPSEHASGSAGPGLQHAAERVRVGAGAQVHRARGLSEASHRKWDYRPLNTHTHTHTHTHTRGPTGWIHTYTHTHTHTHTHTTNTKQHKTTASTDTPRL